MGGLDSPAVGKGARLKPCETLMTLAGGAQACCGKGRTPQEAKSPQKKRNCAGRCQESPEDACTQARQSKQGFGREFAWLEVWVTPRINLHPGEIDLHQGEN
eukprot:1158099-Pelagomonas_calceolata.AAC.6